MTEPQGASLAFNEGCDARLSGLLRWQNPYNPHSWGYSSWSRGWASVHYNWGADVRGRWRYRPLRPLQGGNHVSQNQWRASQEAGLNGKA